MGWRICFIPWVRWKVLGTTVVEVLVAFARTPLSIGVNVSDKPLRSEGLAFTQNNFCLLYTSDAADE